MRLEFILAGLACSEKGGFHDCNRKSGAIGIGRARPRKRRTLFFFDKAGFCRFAECLDKGLDVLS